MDTTTANSQNADSLFPKTNKPTCAHTPTCLRCSANFNQYHNMKPDLLYVLGKGSSWQNNELRYSLRSVEKNLRNFGRIWIVGEDPGFTKNITIIPHPDEIGPHNADGNITRKIIRACREKGLSDTFIKMNDDYIINRPIDAAQINPMHKGDLATMPESYFQQTPWRRRLRRTRDVLLKKGLTALHFDYHAPIPINKHNFENIVSQFDYEKDIGYTTRSIYGNVAFQKTEKLSTEKQVIFKSYNIAQIHERTQQPVFVAYNDQGLNRSMKFWLASEFPEPSAFETGNVDCMMYELARWHNNGRLWKDGVNIFCRHLHKNHNLIKLFSGPETPQLKAKLDFKLNLFIKEL